MIEASETASRRACSDTNFTVAVAVSACMATVVDNLPGEICIVKPDEGWLVAMRS